MPFKIGVIMKKNFISDEYKQVGTDYSDTLNVESYDKYMQKSRDYRKEAEYIIEKLDLSKDSSVLEIGTGTGHFAIEAPGFVKEVTSYDVSKKMLKYAEKKSVEKHIKNIAWVNNGFLGLEEEEIFDAIITKWALHHLPDLWKYVAIKKMYNALKKGGRLFLSDAIFSFDMNNYEENLNKWIEQTKEQLKDDEIGKEVEMHIREEYSTFGWVIEKMLTDTGFEFEIIINDEYYKEYLCVKAGN